MENNVYNEIIMDYYMMQSNKKELNPFDKESKGVNPSCGDEINIQVKYNGNIIEDIAYTGSGCAISQSATNVMIELVKNKSVNDAINLINIYNRLLTRQEVSDEEKEILEDAIAFENIANMPSRVKCAKLAWNTLEKLLQEKID